MVFTCSMCSIALYGCPGTLVLVRWVTCTLQQAAHMPVTFLFLTVCTQAGWAV